ncbi:MAG TPA: O-acetyl-ADP-ribose deacetylase [Planctomycetota bacterium]|nr:O-acetyl-ADP-ribose deacetylase [Planctomycetota bacterium]
MTGLEIQRGDITQLDVDAIVNAANLLMLGGGGVDGAIHAAAGPQLLEACRDVPEVRRGVRCPTGEARITPGFDLRARYVIHTVGPVWRGGESGEDELLAGCYRASLELAEQHALKSIAFPAISCGVYQFPIRRAAAIAVREARSHLARARSIATVLLVAFDAALLEALREASGAP